MHEAIHVLAVVLVNYQALHTILKQAQCNQVQRTM